MHGGSQFLPAGGKLSFAQRHLLAIVIIIGARQNRALFDPLALVKRQQRYPGLDLLETKQALMGFDVARDQQGGGRRLVPDQLRDERGSCRYGGQRSDDHQGQAQTAPPSSLAMRH